VQFIVNHVRFVSCWSGLKTHSALTQWTHTFTMMLIWKSCFKPVWDLKKNLSQLDFNAESSHGIHRSRIMSISVIISFKKSGPDSHCLIFTPLVLDITHGLSNTLLCQSHQIVTGWILTPVCSVLFPQCSCYIPTFTCRLWVWWERPFGICVFCVICEPYSLKKNVTMINHHVTCWTEI